MGAFKVQETFYLGKLDLIVITGTIIEEPVQPGMMLHLPRAMCQDGRVPIAGIEFVRFTHGDQLALTIQMDAFARAPTLEFSQLHGHVLEVSK